MTMHPDFWEIAGDAYDELVFDMNVYEMELDIEEFGDPWAD